jgi:hypothetical protein
VEYRKGPVGALMDEYERVAAELRRVVEPISEEDFVRIVDADTENENCRSVQTIMSHVVGAGFGYADYMRDALSIAKGSPERRILSYQEVPERYEAMLRYTAETLEGRWEMSYDEIQGMAMTVRWGPTYDLEQLLEHAIVHIMRHRRQIEKFMEKFE